jgi:hypothetical protein
MSAETARHGKLVSLTGSLLNQSGGSRGLQ